MDRLSELRSQYACDDTAVDIPNGVGQKSELDEFFTQVGLIKKAIQSIETMTEEIKTQHSEALLNTDQAKSQEISSELDRLMSDITQKSTELKAGLKMIDEQTKRLSPSDKPAEVRIRQNQHQQLTASFLAAMKVYQDASQQYSQKYRDQVKRRIKTRFSAKDGQSLTEEEVDTYARRLLDEGKEDSIFQQSKDTLAQIQENHRDILRIESSMRELNQIFADMALLVEEQGELMDDILVNVGKSVEYVQRGREQMSQAKVYAKKSRKKMCCIIFILLIIAGIIVVPMYFTGTFG
eukprot:NODE_308_length_1500_cov_258.308753_g222_i0.p1 GENE.NODE_308_length_1500_cov_258.308753_g222_i0~~NODE_308_length_1500_cov_258.308753_g222_i0.p1  ORF type:complete len:294 (+),score=102.63 NODE_308_length_1500_cov_258.308753_g222_i0:170-1051(+)